MKFLLGSILFLLSLSAGLLIFGSESQPSLLSWSPSGTLTQENPTHGTSTNVSSTSEVVAKVAAPKKKPQPAPVQALQSAPVAASTTTTPVAAPTPTPAEPAPDLATSIELEVHARVNAIRASQGLAHLLWDPTLAAVARAHSSDMLTNGYFDHTNKAGCSSSCRATNAGYAWRAIGENIYMMSGYTLSPAKSAEKVVTAWTGSSGHYANMINGVYTYQGIGVAVQGEDIYVTELLAKPR